MTPSPLERPKIYLVTWFSDGVRHSRQVLSREAAHDATLMLRERGHEAGWDEIDPFASGGDTNSGVC